MVSPVDPNEIRLTGENSYIRLSHEESGPLTARASHWRVLFSPAGPGHALFLESELTDNQVRIYSDNVALARWLQEEIEKTIYDKFADQSVLVAEATFFQTRRRALLLHGEGRVQGRRDLSDLVRSR